MDGRTFEKFNGNPILDEVTPGNRDPKVFWHEPTRRWVMVLYVELPGGRHTVQFFQSEDLHTWERLSVTEGTEGSRYLFECPDFFELPVDGDHSNRKWVLTAANSEYAVGSFDGKTFVPEASALPGQRGRGFYAAQTFSDLPGDNPRRIQVGWFQTETPGMPFNQSMTVPLELRLVGTPDGPRMTWLPIEELKALRRTTHDIALTELAPGESNPLAAIDGELLEVRVEFEPTAEGRMVLDVRGATITYDRPTQQLRVNDIVADAPIVDGRQRLIVYCDRTGLEVFASDGLTYVPLPYQPPAQQQSISIQAKGGPSKLHSLQVHELQSAWTDGSPRGP
jgi:levanase/fructan beta-fructosidase